MSTCRKCGEKFPLFTIRNAKHPSPFGDGDLCRGCYHPYSLVLRKYTANLNKTTTDPKAAAWVALCCLLAAQKINLVRTITDAEQLGGVQAKGRGTCYKGNDDVFF